MREWNGVKHYTKKENEQLEFDIRSYKAIIKEDIKKRLTDERDYDIITRALLDSSLIFATPSQTYTHKIVQCGEYYQVYDYNKKTTKKNKDIERVNFQNKKMLKSRGEVIAEKEDNLYKNDGFLDWTNKIKSRTIYFYDNFEEKTIRFQLNIFNDELLDLSFNYRFSIFSLRDPPEWLHLNENIEIKKEKTEDEKIILKRNIQRAKTELERLTKTNEKVFKSFITLTIADNITNIEEANELFRIWRTKVQAVLKKQKKEFSYVCVPEFQKRGAVHYHLLTNLDVENSDIIIPQREFTEKQKLEMTEAQRKKCKDVKYWKYGFSNVQNIDDIKNVVGYISKYMTKDIDNRLWGKRRYLASHNLKRPSTLFLNCDSDRGFEYLLDINVNYDLKFENFYSNPLGEVTNFKEYKKKEVI